MTRFNKIRALIRIKNSKTWNITTKANLFSSNEDG